MIATKEQELKAVELIHGFLTSWKKKRSGRTTEGVRWKGTRNSQSQLYQEFWTMNTVKSSFTAFMVSQRKKLQSYGMYQSVRSTDMARLESQVQK